MAAIEIARTQVANILTRIPEAHIGGKFRHIRSLATVDQLSLRVGAMSCGKNILDRAEPANWLRRRIHMMEALGRHKIALGALEPGFLPEDQARCLASVVRHPVT